MYKYKQLNDLYIVSIDNHKDITSAIEAFCNEQDIHSGKIDGLGAVSRATLRFLNPATKKYVDKTFEEQMEISNLHGNISRKDGKVYLHLHATFGRSDYTAIAGHLLTGEVNGACEIFIKKLDGEVGRYFDEETGLNLYDL